MSPYQQTPIRLLPFAALAALASANWAALVTDPPVGRALLAALALSAAAAVLVALGGASLHRLTAWTLAVVATVTAAGLGLLAVGLPADQLAPAHWDELARNVERGIAGLSDDYPYDGENDWSRLALLLGLPVVLAAAAALAFWPGGRTASGRGQTKALILLLAAFGLVATVRGPDAPLRWGLALALVVCAWLWLPGLTRARALPAGAMVAAAVALALPVSGWLDADDPLVDYTEWRWPGAVSRIDYDWDHTYGPLDWSRDGTVVLEARTEQPQYWRMSVLDRFDGFRWVRSTAPVSPPSVRGLTGAAGERLNPEWVERVDLSVAALKGAFVPAPGTVRDVDDLSAATTSSTDGTILATAPLERGERYSVETYAPRPNSLQLAEAPGDYPRTLAPYTTLELPRRGPIAEAASGSATVVNTAITVPPRGQPADAEAERDVRSSAYADVHQLALDITDSERTTYEKVQAIEDHLRGPTYVYSEESPERELPLHAFLFRDRYGYCQQFSGAMTLMLRMLGIPSRVVAGFAPGQPDDLSAETDTYVVRDLDAHSWVEVYFKGIGWATFDPTPAASPARSQSADQDPASFGATAGGLGAEPGRRAQPGGTVVTDEGSSGPSPFLALLAGTGVVGLASWGAVARRRRRFGALAPGAAAEAQLRELRSALPRFGLSVGSGVTLLDLERLAGRGLRPRTANYLGGLRASRYQPRDPNPPTLAARRIVRRELADTSGPGGRLRALLAIPPGGPRLRS